MKIPYFPGCTLKTTAKNLEIPALEVARRLGIEMVELERWNCCGVVSYLASDDLMKHLAPMRNFLRVQEMNKAGIVENENRLVTLCSMCYNTLSLSNIRMNNSPADLQTMNDFMHEEEEIYDGKVEVVHLLEVINDLGWDAVKKQVKKHLNGLKIAPYYGCMLLRPKEVGIDDPENPQILENLVKSLGAEPVKWNSGTRCCGSYHTVKNVDIVVNLAKGILDDAKANGADAVITTCPLCAFNLDSRQKEIIKKYPDFEKIPVLYFSQLMGVAFEIEAEKLTWDLNYVSPAGLFK
ncbi:MAG: CoB--CoM heterodisulfide reductase iron-sulfur subunit B family protein [Candidatus Cloacimonadales bacterium]|nr:CoB--CoM heterodisulfide reductase iron-sulfur subunit B family protein [Candidatus Cloacimonadales bacterium]